MNECSKSDVAIVPDAIDVSRGAETPFGRRWGGDFIQLSAEHLAALQAGQTLALDVQNEYVVFIKIAESVKLEHPSS
jgi:acetyl-CoA acetyltransferase